MALATIHHPPLQAPDNGRRASSDGSSGWWVCIDTETTGLPDDLGARVIEVGMVLVEPRGRPIATWSTLVREQRRNPQRAEAESVHGISPDMLERAPTAEEAGQAIRRQLWTWGSGRLALGSWNRDFDRPMLERSGLTLRHQPWLPCLQLATTPLLHGAGFPHPAEGRRSERAPLQAACRWAGVPPQGPAHRALSDALATVELLRICRDPGALWARRELACTAV